MGLQLINNFTIITFIFCCLKLNKFAEEKHITLKEAKNHNINSNKIFDQPDLPHWS